MTNTALSRRLLKLEASGPQEGLAELTDDELKVLLLETYRARTPDIEPEALGERQRHMAEIEADIIHTAQKQASPDYARHLDWCRSMWRKRTGRDDYVLALTGGNGGFGEYADWDKPRVMERRAALRSQALVQELLARSAAD